MGGETRRGEGERTAGEGRGELRGLAVAELSRRRGNGGGAPFDMILLTRQTPRPTPPCPSSVPASKLPLSAPVLGPVGGTAVGTMFLLHAQTPTHRALIPDSTPT